MENLNEERGAPDIVSGTVPSMSYFGELTTHCDPRGSLTELYRREWPDAPDLAQWNLMRSEPNSVRGMHVHMRHSDFIVVIEGEMLLALRDIRTGGTDSAGIVRLSGQRPGWAFVPPGVVHGFYSPNGNTLVYGLSNAWNPDDEFCCRWDDPDMGIAWPPISQPVISARDSGSGSFTDIVKAWEATGIR